MMDLRTEPKEIDVALVSVRWAVKSLPMREKGLNQRLTVFCSKKESSDWHVEQIDDPYVYHKQGSSSEAPQPIDFCFLKKYLCQRYFDDIWHVVRVI